MDAKSENREFLTSRRARITPEQVGLPIYSDNRRESCGYCAREKFVVIDAAESEVRAATD